MIVALASDHAGLPLKAIVLEVLADLGHSALDLGTDSPGPVDYPDAAEKAGLALQRGEAERAVLLCGSGVGACIAANKMRGVYASVAHDTYTARQGVEHDDMNALCLGARVIGPEIAREIIAAFLQARFLGKDPGQERHARRFAKIQKLEG
jgi:ribose 5-phosphate isomerase B